MRTQAIQDFAGQVWDARQRGELKRDARGLGRALALCAAQDVRDCEGYDPEADARVKWLRAVMDDMRRAPKWKRPAAGTDLEFTVLVLLGRLEPENCGKMAAGGR